MGGWAGPQAKFICISYDPYSYVALNGGPWETSNHKHNSGSAYKAVFSMVFKYSTWTISAPLTRVDVPKVLSPIMYSLTNDPGPINVPVTVIILHVELIHDWRRKLVHSMGLPLREWSPGITHETYFVLQTQVLRWKVTLFSDSNRRQGFSRTNHAVTQWHFSRMGCPDK